MRSRFAMRPEPLEPRALLATITPADYDNDGRSDLAVYVFDDSSGMGRFTVERSSLGLLQVGFGGG